MGGEHSAKPGELFLAYGLVLHVIFLVFQVAAHQAVTAAGAIFQKEAVAAVVAILEVRTCITLHAVDALAAELGLPRTETIQTIHALVDAVGVITIAVLIRIENQIAVF